MELMKNQKIIDGILYEGRTKIGQVEFDKVQIDTLSYMSLTDKVLKMLNGTMEFKADDSIDTDFDEPESENWDDTDEDKIDIEPFDEYSDKTDLVDTYKQIAENAEVVATKITEGVDNKKQVENVEKAQKEVIGEVKEEKTN